MTANFFDYKKMTDRYFYGVALTDEHLNFATEQLRKYIVDGGAVDVVNGLGIGVRTVKVDGKIVEERFVYVAGPNASRKLEVHEIENIGMFLKFGPFCDWKKLERVEDAA